LSLLVWQAVAVERRADTQIAGFETFHCFSPLMKHWSSRAKRRAFNAAMQQFSSDPLGAWEQQEAAASFLRIDVQNV
jgi:hypothetical protein